MSTKIYNGYISTLNIEQLLEKFVAMRDKFEIKKAVLYNKEMARMATRNVDREAFKLKRKLNGNEQYEIYNKTHDDNEKRVREEVILRRERSPHDYSLNCTVIPLGKGKTLLLLYCENKEMIKMWNRLPFIKDYHYQDQTDKPRNISEKNWNIRRKDWDKALGYSAAIEKGYTFTFTLERLPVFVKKQGVLKFIPDDDTRITDLMFDNYIDAECKKLMKKDKSKTKTDKIFSYYRQAKEGWNKFITTPEFRNQKKSMSKYLSKITFDPTQIYLNEKLAKAFSKLKKERGM